MEIKKILFIILFISKPAFSADLQYFIQPYFYNNVDSFQINGLKRVAFNVGDLFDKAANDLKSKERIFQKCKPGNKTDLILYLNPTSFYNPISTTLYTDLKIKVFEAPGKIINRRLIKHQTLKKLTQSPERDITSHYKSLISTLIKTTANHDFNHKIDGSFCKIFN